MTDRQQLQPLPGHLQPSRLRLAAALVVSLAASACVSLAEEAKSAPATMPLCDNSGTTSPWRRRVYTDAGVPKLSPIKLVPAGSGAPAGARAAELPVSLPDKSEFVHPRTKSWVGWREVIFELVLPEGLPGNTVLYFFTKDWDHLWRQVRVPAPPERGVPVRFALPIAGLAAAQRWVGHAHERPWHALTPGQLLEFGCSVDLDTGATDTFAGNVLLTGVWLRGRNLPDDHPQIRNLGVTPDYPRVGEMLEITFELGVPFTDPFDPKSVSVRASIQPPKGDPERVRGFYHEDFLYDPLAPDLNAMLTPHGHPTFRARYTPRQSGAHTVAVLLQVGDRTIPFPELNVDVAPARAGYRGFVRVDRVDHRFLMADDGSHFWGLGMNVRSPLDTRYLANAPYSKWADEGLPLYERLFARFEKHGINVVEVWMSSWWLGLEWINDSPGFHGVGHMNPYRAWMLDYILRLAEKHNIYLILVFNNHGKFGALNDTEWARSPFNVKNGGFLKSCEEFFTDARAKKAFRRFCDYTVARWGHSPHLLTWKLFTEIDLTGASYEFYTTPVMAAWHREMCKYIKRIDVYQHPITTHWMLSYKRINADVASIPELDWLTTDAYYQSGGTKQMLALIRGGTAFGTSHHKPLLVTEFGGSPHADSMGNLIKQAHLGIWTGMFCGSPVAPLFWWFALIDEKDLYDIYTGLDRFSRGEDRTGMTCSVQELDTHNLTLNELRDSDRLLLWGFDSEHYYSGTENATPAEHTDLALSVDGLKPGRYVAEYWHCRTGKIIKSEPLAVPATGAVELVIPPFRGDFAVKLKAQKAP